MLIPKTQGDGSHEITVSNISTRGSIRKKKENYKNKIVIFCVYLCSNTITVQLSDVWSHK
jgi:hypothetical protein